MKVLCKQAPERSVAEQTQTLAEEEKVIVCAHCMTKITDPSKQILVNNAFGHIFANPHGHVFEIGCFSLAPGCRPASLPSTEFSWFIGFAWKIGICRYCTAHLGWIFSSETQTFYGLILEKLIFP